jgi:DNA-directed RNA polymerase specialized sigma24 family protein
MTETQREREFYRWLGPRLLVRARAFQNTKVRLNCEPEDLVQEVISRIGDFFEQHEDGVDLAALYGDKDFRQGAERWCKAVLRNVYVDECRRARARGEECRVTLKPPGPEDPGIDPLDATPDPSPDAMEAMYWQDILQKIAAMPSRHAKVVAAGLEAMNITTRDEKFTITTLSKITGLSYRQLHRFAMEVRDRGILRLSNERDLDDEQV